MPVEAMQSFHLGNSPVAVPTASITPAASSVPSSGESSVVPSTATISSTIQQSSMQDTATPAAMQQVMPLPQHHQQQQQPLPNGGRPSTFNTTMTTPPQQQYQAPLNMSSMSTPLNMNLNNMNNMNMNMNNNNLMNLNMNNLTSMNSLNMNNMNLNNMNNMNLMNPIVGSGGITNMNTNINSLMNQPTPGNGNPMAMNMNSRPQSFGQFGQMPFTPQQGINPISMHSTPTSLSSTTPSTPQQQQQPPIWPSHLYANRMQQQNMMQQQQQQQQQQHPSSHPTPPLPLPHFPSSAPLLPQISPPSHQLPMFSTPQHFSSSGLNELTAQMYALQNQNQLLAAQIQEQQQQAAQQQIRHAQKMAFLAQQTNEQIQTNTMIAAQQQLQLQHQQQQQQQSQHTSPFGMQFPLVPNSFNTLTKQQPHLQSQSQFPYLDSSNGAFPNSDANSLAIAAAMASNAPLNILPPLDLTCPPMPNSLMQQQQQQVANSINNGGGTYSPFMSRVTCACSNCKKAKTRCDDMRPCGRCRRLGREATCVDSVHQRRGRNNVLASWTSGNSSQTASGSQPTSTPSTTLRKRSHQSLQQNDEPDEQADEDDDAAADDESPDADMEVSSTTTNVERKSKSGMMSDKEKTPVGKPPQTPLATSKESSVTNTPSAAPQNAPIAIPISSAVVSPPSPLRQSSINSVPSSAMSTPPSSTHTLSSSSSGVSSATQLTPVLWNASLVRPTLTPLSAQGATQSAPAFTRSLYHTSSAPASAAVNPHISLQPTPPSTFHTLQAPPRTTIQISPPLAARQSLLNSAYPHKRQATSTNEDTLGVAQQADPIGTAANTTSTAITTPSSFERAMQSLHSSELLHQQRQQLQQQGQQQQPMNASLRSQISMLGKSADLSTTAMLPLPPNSAPVAHYPIVPSPVRVSPVPPTTTTQLTDSAVTSPGVGTPRVALGSAFTQISPSPPTSQTPSATTNANTNVATMS